MAAARPKERVAVAGAAEPRDQEAAAVAARHDRPPVALQGHRGAVEVRTRAPEHRVAAVGEARVGLTRPRGAPAGRASGTQEGDDQRARHRGFNAGEPQEFRRDQCARGPSSRAATVAAQRASEPAISAAISATSVGVRPTRTPLASSASAFAAAVPFVPETIAPAWPIVLPGGAVKPAM